MELEQHERMGKNTDELIIIHKAAGGASHWNNTVETTEIPTV